MDCTVMHGLRLQVADRGGAATLRRIVLQRCAFGRCRRPFSRVNKRPFNRVNRGSFNRVNTLPVSGDQSRVGTD